MKKLDEYLSLEYPTVVMAEVREDGSVCYEAYHPDLLGCRAEGDTPEEAKASLDEVRRGYLEILIARGVEPPLPGEASRAEGGTATLNTLVEDNPNRPSGSGAESEPTACTKSSSAVAPLCQPEN